MSVTRDGVSQRQAGIEQELGKLALERVQLTHRIEELDQSIFALQMAMQANTYALRDLDTDEAIQKAKEDEAAQAAKTNTEVTDNG